MTTSQPIPARGSIPTLALLLGQALVTGPCQTSSLTTGCIPCPQICKHRETHGKHFHRQEPKTQCPARPAATPHIQRPQTLPHPGTAVPVPWQVAGNGSATLAVGDKKLFQHLPFPHKKCWQVPVGNPALVQRRHRGHPIVLPEPAPASADGICKPLSYSVVVRMASLPQALWHCKWYFQYP